MKFHRTSVSLVMLVAACGVVRAQSLAAAGGRTLVVDDYFRIKGVEDPQISPDGKWVAYTVETASLKDDKNRKRIWMVPIGGGTPIALTDENESSSHPRWSPDGKFIAFISGREGGGDDEEKGTKQVWILNRQGGEAQQLTDTIQDVDSFAWAPGSDRLVLVLQDASPEEIEAAANKEKGGKAKPKPRPWVIDRVHFKEDEIGYLDRRRTHLYVFTIADRKQRQITSGDYDDDGPAWSPDGSKIAFASNRSAPEPDLNYNKDIWVVAADNTDQGKSLVQVTTSVGTEEAPAWSPDGKWIAYTTQLEPELFQYSTIQIAVSPATGGAANVLTRKLDRNSTIPRFAADGKFIYFIADDDGTQNLLRVPVDGGEITRPIGGRKMVEAYSLGADGTAVATVGELTHPAELYVLPAGGELRKLTSVNDALMAELRLPTVEYVHFKSKDGTTVAGYLYKPPDYQPGVKYPTILKPHGGPVWAYYAEFNFDPQLYAANGYVVLTPNPRGSSGYGLDYCKAIFADWGHKDFEDDMAMVDYAVAQGITDPEKIGSGRMVVRRDFDEFHNCADYAIQSGDFRGWRIFVHHQLGARFVFARLGVRAGVALEESRAVGEAFAFQSRDADHDADFGDGRRCGLERAGNQWGAAVPEFAEVGSPDALGGVSRGISRVFAAVVH